jgi:hypothetical protein
MSDAAERVAAALADRYLIERELGSGGMARVYLARDLKHGRQVAVKVLRADLAAAIGSERFLREIRITAGLNHPHILPLLDSGEADGVLYYVMPYVAGGSLRRLLEAGTPLRLPDVLRITEQVAAALDHAHRHGIVHRDVKPENVLISEGVAVVADFGIARAASAAGREALTRSGFPLGTPGYMSPEQAMGILELDARTDVYSLACVVYEMLVGKTPEAWPSDEAVRLGRLVDAPAEHRERLDRLPGRMEQVLARALAVRPADRFARPGEFAEALAAASERSAALGDAQVKQVLRRAAELQVERPTEEDALTLGTVEQIAAEVGIPPARVREAVSELERPVAAGPLERRKRRRGDVLAIDLSGGGELRESDLPALVRQIEETLGIPGHVSILGGALTWSPAAQGTDERKIVITVAPAGGRTRIHIEERFELSGWRIFIPSWGAAGGIITAALMMLALGLPEQAIPFVGIGMGVAGAAAAVRVYVKGGQGRRRPELEALARALAAQVEQASQLTPQRPRLLDR